MPGRLLDDSSTPDLPDAGGVGQGLSGLGGGSSGQGAGVTGTIGGIDEDAACGTCSRFAGQPSGDQEDESVGPGSADSAGAVDLFDGEAAEVILTRIAEEEGWTAHAWGVLTFDGSKVAWLYLLDPEAAPVGPGKVDVAFVVIEEPPPVDVGAKPPIVVSERGVSFLPYDFRAQFAGYDVLLRFEGKRRLNYELDLDNATDVGPPDGPGEGTVGAASLADLADPGLGTVDVDTIVGLPGGPAEGPDRALGGQEPGPTVAASLEYFGVELYTRTEPGQWGTTTLQATIDARAELAKYADLGLWHVFDKYGSGEIELHGWVPIGQGTVEGDTRAGDVFRSTVSLTMSIVAALQASLYELVFDPTTSAVAAALADGVLDAVPATTNDTQVPTTGEWLQFFLGWVGPWLVEGDLLCAPLSEALIAANTENDPYHNQASGAQCFWDYAYIYGSAPFLGSFSA